MATRGLIFTEYAHNYPTQAFLSLKRPLSIFQPQVSQHSILDGFQRFQVVFHFSWRTWLKTFIQTITYWLKHEILVSIRWSYVLIYLFFFRSLCGAILLPFLIQWSLHIAPVLSSGEWLLHMMFRRSPRHPPELRRRKWSFLAKNW